MLVLSLWCEQYSYGDLSERTSTFITPYRSVPYCCGARLPCTSDELRHDGTWYRSAHYTSQYSVLRLNRVCDDTNGPTSYKLLVHAEESYERGKENPVKLYSTVDPPCSNGFHNYRVISTSGGNEALFKPFSLASWSVSVLECWPQIPGLTCHQPNRFSSRYVASRR